MLNKIFFVLFTGISWSVLPFGMLLRNFLFQRRPVPFFSRKFLWLFHLFFLFFLVFFPLYLVSLLPGWISMYSY